ncbi:hypothetical protein [Rhizobium sp. AN80A]|uniref:hypothetical protein n=1 Tax=Rhizobium sp. AN80A TaxID=3040673 RepID=UPI0024B36E49|nr:hypothetical protein [Rhizobium sp. AN80A]
MTSSSFKRQAPGRAYDFLPPEAVKRDRRQSRPDDVADAEFVVIGRQRGADSTDRNFNGRSFNDNSRSAGRPQPRAERAVPAQAPSLLQAAEDWLQRASARHFVVLVVALCVLVFGLSGGFSGLSASNAAVDNEPLHFTHVTATPRDANGMRVLLINGIIDNVSGTTQMVRPIRANLYADDKLVASVVIDAPTDVIYGGQSRGFSSKIQYPGAKTPEVRLAFMP